MNDWKVESVKEGSVLGLKGLAFKLNPSSHSCNVTSVRAHMD